MLKINTNYQNLKQSYLFRNIASKVSAYQAEHPDKKLYRMGIGDVSLPLCDAVICAMHEAVEEQAKKETFHGYMDECGDAALRKSIAAHYKKRGVDLAENEIFISGGASDTLGAVLDIFDPESPALITEPAYPAYVDANVMAGRKIMHLSTGRYNRFLPTPEDVGAGIIYLCSPNNPTGAVFSKEQLKEWVDYANLTGSVILFDAAYEAFIEQADLPHSIFEIEGAKSCAIEICSLSKTAGFTGTRLGYTVIPAELERGSVSLNQMWVRNRTTKTNGVSYIIQKGAAAVFSDEGQRQIQAQIAVYKSNAETLMRVFEQLGLWYCGGKNAPYIWLGCPQGMSSWEFFDYLLNEIQVVGTPGAGFGSCGEGYFRFSAFGDTEDTKVAAKRIYDLLKK